MTKSDDQITGYGGQPQDYPKKSAPRGDSNSPAKADMGAASDDMKHKAQDVGQEVKREAQDVGDDLKHEAQNAGEQAKQEGLAQVDRYRGTAADELERVARSAKAAAADLESDRPGLSHYVSDVAQSMVDFAEDLRGKSVDELLGDVNRMARQNPGLFVMGSIALGFGVTRFAKASSRRSASDYSSSGRSDRSSGERTWPSDSGARFKGEVDSQTDLKVDYSKGSTGNDRAASRSGDITTGSTLDAPTGSSSSVSGQSDVPIKTDPRTRAGNVPTNLQRDGKNPDGGML